MVQLTVPYYNLVRNGDFLPVKVRRLVIFKLPPFWIRLSGNDVLIVLDSEFLVKLSKTPILGLREISLLKSAVMVWYPWCSRLSKLLIISIASLTLNRVILTGFQKIICYKEFAYHSGKYLLGTSQFDFAWLELIWIKYIKSILCQEFWWNKDLRIFQYSGISLKMSHRTCLE